MSERDKTKTQLDENDISKEMCGDDVVFIQSIYSLMINPVFCQSAFSRTVQISGLCFQYEYRALKFSSNNF